eukprot:COSAG02_NODE_2731_length_8142_cov_5.041775_6_plen_1067_part_00
MNTCYVLLRAAVVLSAAASVRAQRHPVSGGFVKVSWELGTFENCETAGLEPIQDYAECAQAVREFSGRDAGSGGYRYQGTPGRCYTYLDGNLWTPNFVALSANAPVASLHTDPRDWQRKSIYCRDAALPSRRGPVDCVGQWTEWSECTESCGDGTQSRTYVWSTPATGGGVGCTVLEGAAEQRACNEGICGCQAALPDACIAPGSFRTTSGYVLLSANDRPGDAFAWSSCAAAGLQDIGTQADCENAVSAFNQLATTSAGTCGVDAVLASTARDAAGCSGRVALNPYSRGWTEAPGSLRDAASEIHFRAPATGLAAATSVWKSYHVYCRASTQPSDSPAVVGLYDVSVARASDGRAAVLTPGGGFDVAGISCAAGSVGRARASTCTEKGQPYVLDGCHAAVNGYVQFPYVSDCESVGLVQIRDAADCLQAINSFVDQQRGSLDTFPPSWTRIPRAPHCVRITDDYWTNGALFLYGLDSTWDSDMGQSFYCRAEVVAAPPQNCVGSWSAWSQCSELCGGGTQSRSYTVLRDASAGGIPCPASNGDSDVQRCNIEPCVVEGGRIVDPIPPAPPPAPPTPINSVCNNGQCISADWCSHVNEISGGFAKLYADGATCTSEGLADIVDANECTRAVGVFNNLVSNLDGGCGPETPSALPPFHQNSWQQGCSASVIVVGAATGQGVSPVEYVSATYFNTAATGIGTHIESASSKRYVFCRATATAATRQCAQRFWDGYDLSTAAATTGGAAVLTHGTDFDLTQVSCAPGYIGVPSASTCAQPGEAYSLQGCHPVAAAFAQVRSDGGNCNTEQLNPVTSPAECLEAVNAFQQAAGATQFAAVEPTTSAYRPAGCYTTIVQGMAMAHFNSMSQAAGSTQKSDGVAVFCKATIALPAQTSRSASLEEEDSDTATDPVVEKEQNIGAIAIGVITLCMLGYFLRVRHKPKEELEKPSKADEHTVETKTVATTGAVQNTSTSATSDSPYPPDAVVYYGSDQSWAYFKQLPQLFQAGTINEHTTVWVDNAQFGNEWLELKQFVLPWELQGSTFHHHHSSSHHSAPPALPPVPQSEEAIP